MANILLGNLPTYTGDTSGVWIPINDSGNTITYKVSKENLVNATSSGTSGTSGSSGSSGSFGSSGSSGTSGSSGSIDELQVALISQVYG